MRDKGFLGWLCRRELWRSFGGLLRFCLRGRLWRRIRRDRERFWRLWIPRGLQRRRRGILRFLLPFLLFQRVHVLFSARFLLCRSRQGRNRVRGECVFQWV